MGTPTPSWGGCELFPLADLAEVTIVAHAFRILNADDDPVVARVARLLFCNTRLIVKYCMMRYLFYLIFMLPCYTVTYLFYCTLTCTVACYSIYSYAYLLDCIVFISILIYLLYYILFLFSALIAIHCMCF